MHFNASLNIIQFIIFILSYLKLILGYSFSLSYLEENPYLLVKEMIVLFIRVLIHC